MIVHRSLGKSMLGTIIGALVLHVSAWRLDVEAQVANACPLNRQFFCDVLESLTMDAVAYTVSS